MTNGWSGGDTFTQQNDIGTSYELGTGYTANGDISITHIRVWAGLSNNVSSRNGQIWSAAQSVLRTVDIDDTLPSGWTEYELTVPLTVLDGTTFYVSYETLGYYGSQAGGYPRDSSGALVTAIDGRFSETGSGAFPSTVTSTFYGIDIVYEEFGGNVAPSLTLAVSKADLDVAVTATVTDEAPGGVTILWNWGDGDSTSTGAGVVSSSHTYASPGLYAILATATDADGLKGSAAAAVSLSQSLTSTEAEEWIDDIFDAVVSDVQRSGYFRKVNTHEAKKDPGVDLTAAIWLVSLEPIQLSGLASTSAKVVFNLRIYQNFLMEPQDQIDPQMAKAISNLMRRYHDDFDFEGMIRNIDLLGQFGTPLSAQTGYLDIDGNVKRIADMTIPCIVNDVWSQAN